MLEASGSPNPLRRIKQMEANDFFGSIIKLPKLNDCYQNLKGKMLEDNDSSLSEPFYFLISKYLKINSII